MYEALVTAYDLTWQRRCPEPGPVISIVLLTDGERMAGRSAEELATHYLGPPVEPRAIPTFTVLFGESGSSRCRRWRTVTGGRRLDARTVSLADVFTEISGFR